VSLLPPLKWAGGKRLLAPTIKQYFDNYYNSSPWPITKPGFSAPRFVEPFCGGLSVALEIGHYLTLANDINKDLINFYQQVAKGLEMKIECANEKEHFYQYRDWFNYLQSAHQVWTSYRNTEGHPVEGLTPNVRAQLFYYLNRTCFNGLCRYNRKGEFNVPYGRYKTITYKKNFNEYKEVIEAWEFSAVDFSQLNLLANDFIYCDPPYDASFTTYAPGGFSWEDQVRLIEWLAPHQGPILISNLATKRIVKLYTDAGYKIFYRPEPRRISSDGDRKPVKTLLATRNI
jgi:DNA adenine methylase